MKYVLTQSEKKTTRAGKPFLKATLADEAGQTLDNVSIWSDYPGFDELKTGDELSGLVEVNAQGYKNLKTPGSPSRNGGSQGSRRDTQMVRPADTYRAEIIRMAQDRKNESIAYFNATNAAITLVSSMPSKLMGNVNRSILKQEIEYWREWFLQEWKKHDTRTRYA